MTCPGDDWESQAHSRTYGHSVTAQRVKLPHVSQSPCGESARLPAPGQWDSSAQLVTALGGTCNELETLRRHLPLGAVGTRYRPRLHRCQDKTQRLFASGLRELAGAARPKKALRVTKDSESPKIVLQRQDSVTGCLIRPARASAAPPLPRPQGRRIGSPSVQAKRGQLTGALHLL
jgi:hypothetical protein